MARIAVIVAVAVFCFLNAQAPDPRMLAALRAISNHSHQTPIDGDGGFYCPMDPEIRASLPGKCPRCGMTLVEGAPDIVEYPVNVAMQPDSPRATELTRLTFGVVDPRTAKAVRQFEVVHERFYHVFLVSQDLSFFVHTHPERRPDEDFHVDVRFPKPGMYRVLSDFFPSGGTPQLITSTVIVPGPGFSLTAAAIQSDTAPKQTENANVSLGIVPQRAVARQNVSLFFRISPDQGVERYLGAWGHMLAVSSDAIDMMHNHPIDVADTGGHFQKQLQFDMIFPRAGMYRVWVQFQRLGIVNTVAFNIPVDDRS